MHLSSSHRLCMLPLCANTSTININIRVSTYISSPYIEVSAACHSNVRAMLKLKALRKTDGWHSDTEYALGYYRRLARGLGIWPLEFHGFSPNAKMSFVIITQLWMSISLTRNLITKGNCGSVTDKVDVLSLIFCGFLTVMKVGISRVKQQNMLIVVDSAINDWSAVVSEKCHIVMMKYAYIGRIVFLVQMGGAYAAGFPLIFMRLPIINGLWSNDSHNNMSLWQMPIGPRCWIAEDASTYHYFADYILQSVQLFIVCTAYIGCDTYFFGIAMHVCGQLELLHMEIDEMRDSTQVLKQKHKFHGFIRRHDHLLQLAKNFEETFNVIILAQVAVDSLLICISGIALLMTLDSGDFVIISGLIIRIYLVYVQLFMFSYVGEKLSRHAEQLSIAVYNCPWYDMPRYIVKDMRFIIMRTHCRFNLTAGKLYSMNIENFRTTLTKMGSWFSVLRLVFQESA